MYIIEINTEEYLKNNLLFLFTIGLLCVSAGLFLNISNMEVIPIIDLRYVGISKYLDIKGRPTNIIVELTKHIQLFVACNPNDTALIGMYIIVNNTTSLNIPSRADIIKIRINFVTNKYIATSPYFNSSCLMLL